MCNAYHTTGYADTIVIYFVDIVEGIDKQGPDSKEQFEGDMDSNVAVIVARICLCIWGLDRVIRWICFPPVLPRREKVDQSTKELRNFSLRSMAKKLAQSFSRKLRHKRVQIPIFLTIQVNSNHTSIMLSSSWAMTYREGNMKTRKIGVEFVQSKYNTVNVKIVITI